MCMHQNEGIGWLSGWVQHVPPSGSFLPYSISRLIRLCILCGDGEHKLLNERKRHRVPRLSASVESITAKGLESWRGLRKGKMLGIFLVSIMLLKIADCRIQ